MGYYYGLPRKRPISSCMHFVVFDIHHPNSGCTLGIQLSDRCTHTYVLLEGEQGDVWLANEVKLGRPFGITVSMASYWEHTSGIFLLQYPPWSKTLLVWHTCGQILFSPNQCYSWEVWLGRTKERTCKQHCKKCSFQMSKNDVKTGWTITNNNAEYCL